VESRNQSNGNSLNRSGLFLTNTVSHFGNCSTKRKTADLTILQDTALLQYAHVSALPEADSSTVNCLRNCAEKAFNGGLTGSGSNIWGKLGIPNEAKKPFLKLLLSFFVGIFKSQEEKPPTAPQEFQEHLIVARPARKPDWLTLWFVYSFIPLFHYLQVLCGRPTWGKLWGKLQNQLCSCQRKLPMFRQDTKKRDSIATTAETSKSEGSDFSLDEDINYPERWNLEYVTSILTLLAACLLPVIAIIVLSRVHTMGMILGLIALFNTVFATGLILVSPGSSRIEIFSATAT
jgi:hypothetical protein